MARRYLIEQGDFRQWVLSCLKAAETQPRLRVTLAAIKSQTQDAASVTWCWSFHHPISSAVKKKRLWDHFSDIYTNHTFLISQHSCIFYTFFPFASWLLFNLGDYDLIMAGLT